MMTSVIQRVTEIRKQNQQATSDALAADRKEYHEIAVREYLGKATDADADRLAKLMQTLGLDEANFAATTTAIQTACYAVAQAQHATKAADGACEREQAARRESLILTKLSTLAGRTANIEGRRYAELQSAQANVKATTEKQPELFNDGELNKSLAGTVGTILKQIESDHKQAESNTEAKMVDETNAVLRSRGMKEITSLTASK